MKSFQDEVFVITGGGSGIGEQIAKDLLVNEASVMILGRNVKKLEKLKKLNPSLLTYFSCDVSDEASVSSAFKEINKKYGKITGLVNSAGVNPSRNKITKTTEKHWDQTININLNSRWVCIGVIST